MLLSSSLELYIDVAFFPSSDEVELSLVISAVEGSVLTCTKFIESMMGTCTSPVP